MSELEVEYKWLSELKPHKNNTRTHSDAQVEQVAESIKQFGFTNPILVDGDMNIIAGHGRYLAAQELGMNDVPTIELSHLTDDHRRAYIIADNKLAENAGWDEELLKLELGELRDADFDLSVIGFSEKELNDLLAEVGTGLTDEDDVPPVEAPVSVKGDVWVLGSHRIMCGDATYKENVEKLLNGVQPNLMVTDPPYGVDYDPSWRADAGVNKNKDKMGKVENDNRTDWTEAWELFSGDVLYVWHSGLHASEVQASLEDAGFELRSQIMWAKDRLALSRGHYHWQHEPCWYAVRKGSAASWGGDRKQTTLWNIKSRDDGGHGPGTQKPVECMRRPIENNSSVGQAVYEPFSGSGTTIIAAGTIGRSCLAMEISPEYVDVAVRRWQEFTGKEALLEGNGKSFEKIKKNVSRLQHEREAKLQG